jgi:Mrp family chromosome partitioning ATPase
MVDAVLLVAKYEHTTVRQLSDTKEILETSGAKIAGLICNGVL